MEGYKGSSEPEYQIEYHYRPKFLSYKYNNAAYRKFKMMTCALTISNDSIYK